jgi:hypothetical protein
MHPYLDQFRRVRSLPSPLRALQPLCFTSLSALAPLPQRGRAHIHMESNIGSYITNYCAATAHPATASYPTIGAPPSSTQKQHHQTSWPRTDKLQRTSRYGLTCRPEEAQVAYQSAPGLVCVHVERSLLGRLEA